MKLCTQCDTITPMISPNDPDSMLTCGCPPKESKVSQFGPGSVVVIQRDQDDYESKHGSIIESLMTKKEDFVHLVCFSDGKRYMYEEHELRSYF